MLHASWCWLREQCDLIDLINLYYVIFEFQWQNRKFFTFNFYNALTYKKEHLLMKQLLTLMYCGCSNKLWGKMEDSEVKQSKKWWHHLYQLSNDSFTHCTMFSHLVSILKKKTHKRHDEETYKYSIERLSMYMHWMWVISSWHQIFVYLTIPCSLT